MPAGDDPLRRLEEQVARASEKAEQLLRQAAGEAARSAQRIKPPPSGWQSPAEGEPRAGLDLDPLLAALGALRELIPPELRRRLADALRELLLAVRALIDWYLERFDGHETADSGVEDIPVL